MFLRFGNAFDFDNGLMENIAGYMNDEIREQVHFELAPCSNGEFLERYLEMDPDFTFFLEDEFGIIMYKEEKQFTDDELYILSDGLLALIRSTNAALKLTYDKESIQLLQETLKKYQGLTTKVCRMLE